MYNQTKHRERKHFCIYCVNGEQAFKMPEKSENVLKLKNYHKQIQVPLVILADFEAITEKIQSCKPKDDNSYTESY